MMRSTTTARLVGTAFATMTLVSCERPTSAPEPASARAFALAGTVAEKAQIAMQNEAGFDDELVKLALDVPGFGGAYVDGGTTVVWVRDATPESRTEIESAMRVRGMLPRDASGIVVRPAQFDFVELAYLRAIIPRVLPEVGLAALDVDDRNNRVLVGLSPDANEAAFAQSLRDIGVPDAAVHFAVVESSFEAALTDLTSVPRGGYRIGRTTSGGHNVCTLGANARSKTSSDWYFLTAGHCTSDMGGVDTSQMHQPAPGSGIIGVEYDEDGYWNGTHWSGGYGCSYSDPCYLADVALFRYTARSPDLRVARAQANSITLDSPSSWAQTGLHGNRFNPGTAITMVGSVSGRRSGTITHRCIDIKIHDYHDFTPVWMRCFDLANYVSNDGDSGAPVLYGSVSASEIGVFGIHAGRTSVGSTSYARYTPAINVRGAIYIVPDLGWCASMAPGC